MYIGENQGELTQMRCKGQRMVLYAGCCLVFTGVVNVVMGVLMLVYKDGLLYPLLSASPIWSGGVATMEGIFAILAVVFKLPSKNTSTFCLRTLWAIAVIFQFGVLIFNCRTLAQSIKVLILCLSLTPNGECRVNVIAICTMTIVMGFFAVLSIIGILTITKKCPKISGFDREYNAQEEKPCEEQKQSLETSNNT